LSLRLDLLITKARLKSVRLSHGDAIYPPSGKNWLILNGIISHVTGTDTTIWASTNKPWANHGVLMNQIPSATASGSYPFFRTKSEEQGSAWQPYIIPDTGRLRVEGAATIKVNISMLEWGEE
jgi:hypothetical protein